MPDVPHIPQTRAMLEQRVRDCRCSATPPPRMSWHELCEELRLDGEGAASPVLETAGENDPLYDLLSR